MKNKQGYYRRHSQAPQPCLAGLFVSATLILISQYLSIPMSQHPIIKQKKPHPFYPVRLQILSGGELGIRTPGPVTVNSFQDCRNRPLCQLSGANIKERMKQQQSIFLSANILLRCFRKPCKSLYPLAEPLCIRCLRRV